MGTFGLRLRRERENKGLRLIDVAKTTRVGVHYLAALEHEDFDALPNDVFVKGFVRVYAECLEIDGEQLVDEYLELARERRPVPANGDDKVVQEMSRMLVHEEDRALWKRPALFGVASVVVLSLVAVWWWSGSGEEPAVAELQSPSTELAPAATPAAVTTPPPVEPEALPVEPEPLPPPADPEPVVEPPVLPEPEPEPEPQREAAPVATSDIEITQFGVGTGVSNRQLVGEAASFPAGTRVYFWNRVMGAASGETIDHVWFHEGRRIASTSLTIGGSHWRTQSRKTLWKEGRWAVEARDAAGNVLARSEFDCLKP